MVCVVAGARPAVEIKGLHLLARASDHSQHGGGVLCAGDSRWGSV